MPSSSFWCRGDSSKITLNLDPSWINLSAGKWQIAIASSVFIQKTQDQPQYIPPLLLTSNIVQSQYRKYQ